MRSLPERTVDGWVTASICAAFERALIWAPTQLAVGANWDFGVGLGDGKVFILEDKATTASGAHHRLEIDRQQLDWYCDVVEPSHQTPVFYVLPRPPWQGPPTGCDVVPDQAARRAGHPPFEEWAFVARCHAVRTQLAGRASINSQELPFLGCLTLRSFLTGIRDCEHGARVIADDEPLPSRVTVNSEEAGRPRSSVLGVWVPAVDLPNFYR